MPPVNRRPTGPPKPRVAMLMMRVWDLPTRLFHWTLAVLVIVSYVSAKTEADVIHYLSGFSILTLLVFRIAWGFVGSQTSRFSQFIQTPAAALAHLARVRRREPDVEVGHNAAGGWAVVTMLAALALQVLTGLFAGDPDGGGPFRNQIPGGARTLLTAIHNVNVKIIIALVVLHVLAIAAYAVLKRHHLISAMVTGRKRLPATVRQPRFVSSALALVLFALTALAVFLLVRFA